MRMFNDPLLNPLYCVTQGDHVQLLATSYCAPLVNCSRIERDFELQNGKSVFTYPYLPWGY
jgi:hypothetical protein